MFSLDISFSVLLTPYVAVTRFAELSLDVRWEGSLIYGALFMTVDFRVVGLFIKN